MRLPSWLRAARSALAPAPERKRPAPGRLMLEVLEARDCPSAGQLDPTFGSGGIVHLPNATDASGVAVAVQPDGKVVVAGQILLKTGYTDITVQRLNTDGSLDTMFNKTGSVTIASGKSDYPTSVALQPDGKILVGGSALSSTGAYEFLIARVNANGTLDSTFASKGIWVYASPAGVVEGLAVRTDPANPSSVTDIVAAARGSVNGTPCFEAIDLTSTGKLNPSFGSGGLAVFANLNGGPIKSVAVDPLSGEIYLAGMVSVPSANGSGCLAALTPAGALDPAFGGGAGYVLDDPTGSQDIQVSDVVLQRLTVNGQAVSRLLVAGVEGGNIAPTAFVTAYTPAGALDTSFGAGGSFTMTGVANGYNPFFSSLALEADGSIVVGGYQTYTTDGTGYYEMLVGHLTADGAADATFGPDGTGFTVVQDGQISKAWGVAIDPTDGSILVCGTTATKPSPAQAVVARFTAS